METLKQDDKEMVKFCAAVQRFKDSGVSGGEAIRQSRRLHPEGYNQWCIAGRPQAQTL
jgi:hypothetical protein